ncbi:MATE family efflux transporter [Saliphagus sp. GCM10025334]
MVEKVFRTSMRTTDVVVAGLLSPVAVAAVGTGDAFSQIITRIGNGLGDATIALSSQDTGSDAIENRGEAISQALILGILVGIPFVFFGLAFSYTAIAVLGAEREVVQMGGQYLMIIMIVAPLIHLSRICVRALQGTGDTQTPMYIRGGTNILNLVGTVVLAFGLGPFPRLSVLGIALATVVGETVSVVLFLWVMYRPSSNLQFRYPTNLTITKQLVAVSAPRFAEGVVVMIAELPFNAVLFFIGTEANAAYHIGRRVYRQVGHPVASGFNIAANILAGQSLGNDPETAYVSGLVTTALAIVLGAVLSALLFIAATPLTALFTSDPETATLTVGFVRTFAIAGVFYVSYRGFEGGLRGGSDTRNPFFATLVGMFVFLLGTSYVGGVYLGYGLIAVYFGVVLDYSWRAVYLGYVYYRRNWIKYGTSLMKDRGSIPSEEA